MEAYREGPPESAQALAALRTGPSARSGGERRRAAALALGLVAFLVLWLGALASVARANPITGYEVQSTTSTLGPGTTPTDVMASCTLGKKVVGGGFHVQEPNDLRIYASEPGDALGVNDHTWHALVRNAVAFSEQVTVYAVCISAPLTGYEQVPVTATVAPGQTANVLATCTPGNKVTGGGFHLADPDTIGLFASEPGTNMAVFSDHMWNVIAANGGTAPQPVTSTAICLTGPLDAYEEPSQRVLVTPGATVDVTATCSAANKALGGGFDIETPTDVKVFSSEPTDANGTLSDRSWNSLVRNAGTGIRQTTVSAICAAGSTPPPTVTGVSPSSGPASGFTTVTITGTDFLGTTAVNFGATPASFFTVDSSNQITASSPPGTGTVDVTVTTPGGTSPANPPGDQFTYTPVATITTAIDQTGPLALGDTFTDTATVVASAGGSTPTGTVTFDVFGPNSGSECSGAPMFTDTQTLVSGPASGTATATSAPFTGTDAGGYQVVASYSGDANYVPSATGCFDSAETTSVNQETPTLTTQVSQDPITQGDAFTDTATLAPVPSGATPPTGTVTFDVFGPTGCDSTPVLTSTTSVDAAGTATSGPLTPPSKGTYTIVASYSGDPNYAPASNLCGDETVTVRLVGPTITTQVAPASITSGQSFADTATLSSPSNFSPTGTVTFSVYGPGDPTCATTPVFTSVGSLAGSSASMGPFTPAAAGTYQVVATYSGDGNFAPSSTPCGDPKEVVTVAKAAAAITTAVSSTPISLGGSFHDTATLTPPAGSPAPTGQASFAVYGPADPRCTGTPVFTSTNPLGAPGATAVSGTFTPTEAGTYQVVASYGGDANYAPAATACGDAGETVVVGKASLALSTQVVPASVALGGSFHDTATLGSPPAGAAAPTGSVTFRFYSDAGCSTQVFSSTNPVGAVSGSFTPTAAGTYRVVASYGGDANYAPAATACGDAGETVVVGKVSLALSTQVVPASVALGGSFHDTATLGSPPAGAAAPTGSVTFRFYSDAGCSTQVFSSTNPVGAVSGSFTPTAAGTYRVVASYGGDANYAPAATACGDAGETVVVGKVSLALSTQVVPASVALGGSFHDTATLGSPPAGAAAPTGSVTFRFYSDAGCSTQVFSSTNPVGAVSGSFTPTAAGTYRVVASYGGDANYAPAATACGDPGETVAVGKAAVGLATAVAPASIGLGASFHDAATLTGAPAGAPAPTGSVTFRVYSDAACTNQVFTSTNPLTGTTATSGDFTPTGAGSYLVVAAYAGDANYAATTSTCGDPGETVTVNRATLALTTQVAPATIALGGGFHDTATLGPPAGAATPTGTVRYDVYGPADAICDSTPAFGSTNAVGAPSDTFTPTAGGTYRVVASYSGDANYTASATACGDPGETVTVTRATIAIATHVSSASVAQGSPFRDTATLGPAAGPAPTGAVTFRVYGPGGTTCTAPALSSTNPVSGGAANSDGFAPAQPGAYRIVASYTGDAYYAPATSACDDPAETVVVVSAPAITRLNPRSGPEAGGNPVVITGSGFTGASAVHFGQATAAFTVDSPTQITATAPAGTGAVDVTVTARGVTSAGVQYIYNAAVPPVVTGVTPSSGTTDGGNGVLITGRNLGGATAVDFGGRAGTVVSVNPAGTQLIALAPPGTAGTVDVTVTTPFGTSPTSPADRYTYVVPPPAPTVTGVNPATGTAGASVTITGTNLGGATAVRFGAAAASGFTVDGPTQITATAPAGTGAVDVTVTTPGGTSATGAGDTFTYAATPGGGGGGGTTGGGGGGTTGGVVLPAGQPTAQTGPPKAIDSTTEEFTATINPHGLPTTMHFEYTAASGAAANIAAVTYAAKTPEQFVGSDFVDHTVTARVAGLVPNSVYHVRAVASNARGAAASGDTAFTSATDPPPPPPVLGTAFNAEPVSGIVYVLLPGKGHVSQAHASAAKGVGFIPLTEARQLPVGTIFDTTAGIAKLTTATATKGATQSGNFGSGIFKLLQDRKQKGLAQLALVLRPGATKKCATAGKAQAQTAARKALPKTVLTLLRATAKGRFQTRGRYSSATVRGTSWTTSDRCDGTLTRVTRGVVVVNNIRRHRQIVLRAGKAYLAKP